MIFILVSLVLAVPYAFLLLYLRKAWVRIPLYGQMSNPSIDKPHISVIIAARNEEKNIHACISSILQQTYPAEKFEVIVVNDHSTDNTASIVQSFEKKNVRLLNLADLTENKKINSFKKRAIETAIGIASGELIVTTDADCVVPLKWLETIAGFQKEENALFVVLLVAFNDPHPGDHLFRRFFKIFQSLDFMSLQGVTGAAVSNGFLNMCNGANLAYEKQVFYDVNGFEGIDKVASGDDMLLMHKVHERFPHHIGFLKSQDIVVTTQSCETVNEFLNQRIRWASKSNQYSDNKIVVVLLLVYLLNIWVLALAIFSFFFATAFYSLLLLMAVKIAIELFFLFPVAGFFKKKKLLWWFIPAQPFHIIYTVVAGWLGMFGSYQWKGRKVK